MAEYRGESIYDPRPAPEPAEPGIPHAHEIADRLAEIVALLDTYRPRNLRDQRSHAQAKAMMTELLEELAPRTEVKK